MSFIEQLIQGKAMRTNPHYAQEVISNRAARNMSKAADYVYGKPGSVEELVGPYRNEEEHPGAQMVGGTGIYDMNVPWEQRYLQMQQRMANSGIAGWLDQQGKLLQDMQGLSQPDQNKGKPPTSIQELLWLNENPQFKDEFYKLKKSGSSSTNIHMPSDPLKASEGKGWVFTDGPRKGLHPRTNNELQAGIAENIIEPMTDATQKDADKRARATGVTNTLRTLLDEVDKAKTVKGDLTGNERLDELLSRSEDMVKSTFSFFFDEYDTYDDVSTGLIAPLVRNLGESGALANEDIERAIQLIPQFNDSKPVRERKLRIIDAILRIGEHNKNNGIDVRNMTSTMPVYEQALAEVNNYPGANQGRPDADTTEWEDTYYEYKWDAEKRQVLKREKGE